MCIRDRGIDVVNLVRTGDQLNQLKQEAVSERANQSLIDQAGQLAGTPLLDPSKNPEALDGIAQQAAAAFENLAPPQQ